MTDNPYRDLPGVDQLVEAIESRLPHALVVTAARQAIEDARSAISVGDAADVDSRARELVRLIERQSPLRVINATGVLLHTNLGRAAWSQNAIDAALETAAHATNLEIDVETGDRSRRGGHVTELLGHLTGAEDSLVVNNNASSLLLTLAAMAGGRSVPISRGELIEIGGSYRLPDVMSAAGVKMVEVGTTNRTRIGDYQVAIQTHDCPIVLKVHPSNYRVDGFTEETTLDQLVALDLPVIYDLGSGLLDSQASWVPRWLSAEPAVRQSLDSGAEVVMFSGDKLLGGPQAGVIAGTTDALSRLRSHPLARALRVDGVTYAALGATLTSYLDMTPEVVPFWRQALTDANALEARCSTVAERVGGRVEASSARVGAGSAPGLEIPGPIVRLGGEASLFERLLSADVPVLTRREAGDLLVDLRAVEPADDAFVADTIAKCR